MKIWTFRETGEISYRKNGEWGLAGTPPEPYHWDFDDDSQERPLLSIEILDYDPLEPIREIWTRYNKEGVTMREIMEAIKKAVGDSK